MITRLCVVLVAAIVTFCSMTSVNAQNNTELVTITGPADYAVQEGDTMHNLNEVSYREILNHPRNFDLNTTDRHFTTTAGGPGVWLYPHRNDTLFVPEGYSIVVRRLRTPVTATAAATPTALVPTVPGITAADLSNWGWWLFAALLIVAVLTGIAMWLLWRRLNQNEVNNQLRLNRMDARMQTFEDRQQETNRDIRQLGTNLTKGLQDLKTTLTQQIVEANKANEEKLVTLVGQHVSAIGTTAIPQGTVVVGSDKTRFILVHDRENGETMGMLVDIGTSITPMDNGVASNGPAVFLNQEGNRSEREGMESREKQHNNVPATV